MNARAPHLEKKPAIKASLFGFNKSAKIGPIGVDCAMSALHMVQFEQAGQGKLILKAKASLPFSGSRQALLENPKKLRQLVAKGMKQNPFIGRRVVSVLPAPGADIFPLSYHVATGQADAAGLFKVLADRLDGDLADLVIDYVPVRMPDNDDRMALVAVARRAVVIEYLEALRHAGLQVDCLEIGPVAIRRFVRSIGRHENIENVMTVNFGKQASFLTVVSGRRLLMDQQVAFGEQDLVKEISQALDLDEGDVPRFVRQLQLDASLEDSGSAISDATATLKEILTPCFLRLVEEINRVLIYTASQTRGESIHRIYLLGGLARWPGIDTFLNNLIHVDVETIPNPLSAFTPMESEYGELNPAPELAVAAGLGLHGMLGDDEV